MKRWKITVEAYPHSLPGKTSVEAQELCGGRLHTFDITADEFRDAVKIAFAIAKGVESNPHCWKAPIRGVVQDTDRTGTLVDEERMLADSAIRTFPP